MAVGSVISSVIGGALKPVAGVLNRREDRKQARETGAAKLALAKQRGDAEVTLTDAEWEAQSVRQSSESWKDEYVTLVITAPILLAVIGAVQAAWVDADTSLLDAARIAAAVIVTDLQLDYSMLTTAAVFAALGLKMWRFGK